MQPDVQTKNVSDFAYLTGGGCCRSTKIRNYIHSDVKSPAVEMEESSLSTIPELCTLGARSDRVARG